MADIASIAAMLGSVKTATELAKLIKDSDLSLEKAEVKLKLAELISALADAKIEASEIQQLLIDKERRIQELEEKQNIHDQLIYEKSYYFLKKDDHKDGPFCQRCYDVEKQLIRLQGGNNDYWTCHECKSRVYGPNHRSQSIRTM